MKRILTLGLVASLPFTGCADRSPRRTVEDFFSALHQGDKVALERTLSLASRPCLKDATLSPKAVAYDITEVKEEAARAVVTVNITDGSSRIALPLVTIKEEEDWRVDLKATAAEAVQRQAQAALVWLAGACDGLKRALDAEAARLGQALQNLGESMGKAMEHVGAGLQKGLKSMEDGLRKGLESAAPP